MRVLICAPHFYDPGKAAVSRMGSAIESREERIRTSLAAIRTWASQIFDREYFLGTADTVANDICRGQDRRFTGDIVLCTLGDRNLFSELSNGVNVHRSVHGDDPRYLGYAARRVFAAHADEYDLFVYIEDDMAIHDPGFFEKITGFYELHGEQRVILPNRLEWFGLRDMAVKVYLDHDHPKDYQVQAQREDEPLLTLPTWPSQTELELTTSVGSGAFTITRSQLKQWMSEPDFRDPERFRSARMHPLEVAQMPMAGRLPVYRPSERNADFLEVHHLSARGSNGLTPSGLLKADIKPLLMARRKAAF